MSYFDCFLIPIAVEKLSSYQMASARVAPLFIEHGAIRIIETFLDSASHEPEPCREPAPPTLPDRDFVHAADAKRGEIVVLSWTEWPCKEARDNGLAALLNDPRAQPLVDEPAIFEARRLISGGFSAL